MDNDLISRSALQAAISKLHTGGVGLYCTEEVHDAINNAPAVEPEVQTAHWRKYSSDEWICTNCGYDKYCDTLDGGVLPPFCENCGAKIVGTIK